jgi:hypothetical protein
MLNARHAWIPVLLLGCLPSCHRPGSPLCPKGTFPVAERSDPGKTQWCESEDKRRAQWIEWHPSTTQLRQSCAYHDGKAEGSFTAWHPNGRTWVQGQFANGLKIGKWKQWDQAGNIVAEGDYITGRLVAGAPVAGMAGCEKAVRGK